MKIKVLSALLLVLLIFTGCGKNGQSNSENSYNVTDMTSHKLTFSETPKRIIAMNPADITNLIGLGCLDMLVGRGEFCTSPAAIKSLPQVGTGPNTNAEEIIMLKPDLVIMNTMSQTSAHAEALEKAGIEVLSVNPHTIDETAEAVRLIGQCLNKNTEAEEAIKKFNDKLNSVKTLCAEAPFKGKTVYYEVSPLKDGLWAAGNDTFLHEIGSLMGLKNIFEGQKGWIQVSEEQVISKNPDYIIILSPDINDKDSMIEEIYQRKGWDKITAVKEKHIFAAASDRLSQPSLALADGAEELLQSFIKNE